MPQVKDDAVKCAIKHFESGYNCAESVALAVCEAWDLQCPALPRAATALGCGVGLHGDICGAIAGGQLILSIIYGRDSPKEEAIQKVAFEKYWEFINRFKEEHGSLKCWELMGMDGPNDDWLKEHVCMDKCSDVCKSLIEKTVRNLLDVLDEYDPVEP